MGRNCSLYHCCEINACGKNHLEWVFRLTCLLFPSLSLLEEPLYMENMNTARFAVNFNDYLFTGISMSLSSCALLHWEIKLFKNWQTLFSVITDIFLKEFDVYWTMMIWICNWCCSCQSVNPLEAKSVWELVLFLFFNLKIFKMIIEWIFHWKLLLRGHLHTQVSSILKVKLNLTFS